MTPVLPSSRRVTLRLCIAMTTLLDLDDVTAVAIAVAQEFESGLESLDGVWDVVARKVEVGGEKNVSGEALAELYWDSESGYPMGEAALDRGGYGCVWDEEGVCTVFYRDAEPFVLADGDLAEGGGSVFPAPERLATLAGWEVGAQEENGGTEGGREEDQSGERQENPRLFTPEALVLAAAVAEYMTAEILELAGNKVMARSWHGDRNFMQINAGDVVAACKEDKELSQLAWFSGLPTTEDLPDVLQEGFASQFHVDVTWRAGGRFPGGNIDSFVVGYQLSFDRTTGNCTRARVASHRVFDGAHSASRGDLPQLAARLNALPGGKTAYSTVLEKLRGLFCPYLEEDDEDDPYKTRRKRPTEGVFRWTVLDTIANDHECSDPEWGSFEVRGFAQLWDVTGTALSAPAFARLPESCRSAVKTALLVLQRVAPFLPIEVTSIVVHHVVRTFDLPPKLFVSASRSRQLGPQYRPQSRYAPLPVSEPTEGETELLQFCSDLVGMGRPEQFADSSCRAAHELNGVATVSTSASVELPPVLPRTLMF
jgi:uncharacterized protein YidB (DUF937 family)